MSETPAFEAPWHAEVFALTVALNEAGQFSWAEWVACFSKQLQQDGLAKELNGGDDYFLAWISALEGLLTERGLADHVGLGTLKAAWTEAYLATPHGAPVRLSE